MTTPSSEESPGPLGPRYTGICTRRAEKFCIVHLEQLTLPPKP